MSRFTKEMVDGYANDLLIGLSDEENKMVLDEFESIDSDIDIINTIDGIEDVSPMFYPLDNNLTYLREDKEDDTPCIDDLLSNAKDKIGREIEIPKVVE